MTETADYWVWIDGEVRRPEDSLVSVLDHGFLYGDTVYETLRSYEGRYLAVAEHMTRLEESARALALTIPGGRSRVVEALNACAHRRPSGHEVGARVTVSRGVGPLGLDPDLCRSPRLVVVSWAIRPGPHPLAEEGVRIIVTRVCRNSVDALDPHIKSGNLLNNALAYHEVKRAGAFDGVLLTRNGDVAECTSSNIFWVRRGELCTSVDDGILLGVTRRIVIEQAERHGVSVRRVAVPAAELRSADEVFLTSSLKGVLPVIAVDDRTIGDGRPGPLTRSIDEWFLAVAYGSRPS